MRVVLLREIPEDDDLRLQWNALLDRIENPQVFYTYEWALAVQRAYSNSLRPLIFLAYNEGNRLCGVAALAENASRDQVSFLGATTGDYCDFLSARDFRASLVKSVLAELKKENVGNLTLTNLPADSPTVPALRQQAREFGYHCFARQAYLCSQFSLKALDRAGNEKPRVARPKMIRRSLKAMGSGGAICLDHAHSWGAVEPILPQFMQAHVARFLVTGRISNMARAERRVFLTELARLLSGQGWLCLTRMMTGAKTVAWNYGFQFRGSWFWYQPTFDSEVEKYSPGYCLLAKIVEEAAKNPEFETVDLGLGAEEYKDRVANQERETLYVTLKASAVQHGREMGRYFAAKAVKSSPRIEHGIRAAGAASRHLRERIRRDGPGTTVGWALRRMWGSLFGRDEVFFYEIPCGQASTELTDFSLAQIDLDLLARATMHYVDDESTLSYFLRCKTRLRGGDSVGYALLHAEGQPVHFLWTAPFAGFHLAELNSSVPTPSSDAMLMFDAWTPRSERGRGYYARTIEFVAATLRRQGKRAWVFSAAANVSSVRGLEKMAFPRRFSVVRHKLLWWQWLSRRGERGEVGSQVLAA